MENQTLINLIFLAVLKIKETTNMTYKKLLLKSVSNVVEGLDLLADIFESEINEEDKLTMSKVNYMFNLLEEEIARCKNEDIPPEVKEKLNKYL